MERKKYKSLKFAPHLIEQVLSGSKTITWRLFDDKDLQKDDLLELRTINGELFTKAIIVSSEEKRIKDLTQEDLKLNQYENINHVFKINRKYYGDKVDLNTIVKIISFKILGDEEV